MTIVRVLFVCTGNICRSPTAEGVLRQRLEDAVLNDRIEVDSAGLGGWHVGQPPDARAIRCAAGRGYDLTALRARQFRAADFDRFEHVVAMDRGHLHDLRARCPADAACALRLFLEFLDPADPNYGHDVPDPYYGDMGDYEHSLNLIERATPRLIAALTGSGR